MTRKTCLVCFCLCVLGCSPGSTVKTAPDNSASDYEDAHQHHGHAHSHAENGPHDGHLVEVGDEQYHIEWLHDDESGLVTVYVLDSEMEKEVPIEAPSLTIERTIGDETKRYELMPVDAESGSTARFETTDKALIEALKLAGQGVEAKLFIDIGGQSFVADFKHEPH